ncbi:hypothetical protein [Chromobacterium violaceum]|uniref:hypothetical protein n=1 Tax=Chromobacterium violaceum TaxID=536 RepID=UPI0009D985B4|nr:hypothetical protein [Chromobacterium violaceum]OQS30563.1 hypothetical protein B0T41_01050 [Chromobacterium violaceum]
MTNRLTRARAHGLRPFFIGASIPLRSMDGGAFSFVHAREHQVVDALARAAQDTGAEVRGYTTAQAMHIQITGAACHRDRLIVLLQRHIREVCQSPAPNAEAISDVLRELRATSEWDLSSRRLERWLLRGGALATDSAEEATILLRAWQDGSPPMPSMPLPAAATQIIVLCGSSSRPLLIRGKACARTTQPKSLKWEPSDRHTLFDLELDAPCHVALIAALPAVREHMRRLQIEFSATFVDNRVLMAIALPGIPATKAFLRQSILASFESCREEAAAATLAQVQDIVGHGNYLLERLEHGGVFGSISITRFAGYCADPKTADKLARRLDGLLQELRGPRALLRMAAGRIGYPPSPRDSRPAVALGAVILPGTLNERLARQLAAARYSHPAVTMAVVSNADHLVCHLQGEALKLEPAMSAISAAASVCDHPDEARLSSMSAFAWARSDAFGQQVAGHSGCWVPAEAMQAPSHLHQPCAEGVKTYLLVFDAPSLLAADYPRHMALAHALMHRTGLVAESRLFVDIQSWVLPGLIASSWGFRLAVGENMKVADADHLRSLVQRWIKQHHAKPHRGAMAAKVRHLISTPGRHRSVTHIAQEQMGRCVDGEAAIRSAAYPPLFRIIVQENSLA